MGRSSLQPFPSLFHADAEPELNYPMHTIAGSTALTVFLQEEHALFNRPVIRKTGWNKRLRQSLAPGKCKGEGRMALLGTNGRRSPWSCQGWTFQCRGISGRGGRGVGGWGEEHPIEEGGGGIGWGFMGRKPGKGITFEM